MVDSKEKPKVEKKEKDGNVNLTGTQLITFLNIFPNSSSVVIPRC